MWAVWWPRGWWIYWLGWPLDPLVMLGFWAVLIVTVVVFLRRLSRASPAGSDSALEILRTRYARGELSREDFETMRRDLMAR
jgi:putative membrane protein